MIEQHEGKWSCLIVKLVSVSDLGGQAPACKASAGIYGPKLDGSEVLFKA